MTILKSTALAAALLGLPAAAMAQSVGYSITDTIPDNPTPNPGQGVAYSFDLQTGLATNLGIIEYGPSNELEGLAGINGNLIGVSEDDDTTASVTGGIYNVLPAPGTRVADSDGREGTEAGAAFNPTDGLLYNVQGDENAATAWFYQLNYPGGDGSANLLFSQEGLFLDGLAINAAGEVYASDFRITDSLYRVNLETGAFDLVGSFGLDDVNQDSGLAFDADGQLWGITEIGDIYAIDTASGGATFTAFIQDAAGNRLQGDFEGFEILPAQEVPAPAALALFGLGAAGLGFARHQGAKRR